MNLTCRFCNHTLTDHSAVLGPNAKPNEGDISVCLYCGTLAQFHGGLFVAPNLEELESFLRDPAAIEAMYMALILRRQLQAKEN